MDGTKLVVYPRSSTTYVEDSPRTLKPKKGSIIVWRGDLVHSGAAYTALNYRLHAFLECDGMDRSKNSTQLAIPIVSFPCRYCGKPQKNARSCTRHEKTCPTRNDEEAVEARKKQRQNQQNAPSSQQTKCEFCGKDMMIRNLPEHQQNSCKGRATELN